MTVATTGASPWGEFHGAGQEEVAASDIKIPRLRIVNKEGVFENSVTKNTFPSFRAVVLGMYKQRSMFPQPYDPNAKVKAPICKSNDNITGFPSEPNDPKSEIYFEWENSGFDPARFNSDQNEYGRVVLPCDQCQFAIWTKDRRGKNVKPACDELHTYCLLILDEAGNTSPALFSVKSSNIKNSQAFLSAFANGRPFFTAITTFDLTQQSRGDVEYCVVNFRPDMQNVHGDIELWRDYNAQLLNIKDILHAPPRREDESDEAPAQNQNQWAAPAAQAPDPWAGVATDSGAVPASDPWATGAPAAAPTPTPAPAAAPQHAAPRPPVAAPTPPPATQAPRPAPAPAAAPVAAAPVQQVPPPAARPDDDDMPF